MSELWGGRAPGLKWSPSLSSLQETGALSDFKAGLKINLPVASGVLTYVFKSTVLLHCNIL